MLHRPPARSKAARRQRIIRINRRDFTVSTSFPLLWYSIKMAPVPESLLKKRQRDEKWAADKAAASDGANKASKDKGDVIFKKAEVYVKEYRAQVRVYAGCACEAFLTCIRPPITGSRDLFTSLVWLWLALAAIYSRMRCFEPCSCLLAITCLSMRRRRTLYA